MTNAQQYARWTGEYFCSTCFTGFTNELDAEQCCVSVYEAKPEEDEYNDEECDEPREECH